MTIIVIGRSGLIGKKFADIPRNKGHEVLAASPTWHIRAVADTISIGGSFKSQTCATHE